MIIPFNISYKVWNHGFLQNFIGWQQVPPIVFQYCNICNSRNLCTFVPLRSLFFTACLNSVCPPSPKHVCCRQNAELYGHYLWLLKAGHATVRVSIGNLYLSPNELKFIHYTPEEHAEQRVHGGHGGTNREEFNVFRQIHPGKVYPIQVKYSPLWQGVTNVHFHRKSDFFEQVFKFIKNIFRTFQIDGWHRGCFILGI